MVNNFILMTEISHQAQLLIQFYTKLLNKCIYH